MYNFYPEIGYDQIVEGVQFKILCNCDSMLMVEMILRKGAELPEHIHLSDHTGYLLQGKLHVTIDGLDQIFVPGDTWCIGKGIRHHADVLEDSKFIEVYKPQKSDFENYSYVQDVEFLCEEATV
jgi:quercetin dioxygenase-like cupin family protein